MHPRPSAPNPDGGESPWEFEARALVYGLLARLFLAPPETDLLQTLRDPVVTGDWPWGTSQSMVQQGLALLRRALPEATAEGLTEEYRALFWGPGAVLAPPWESVYLDREQVMFGLPTLQVRDLFRRFGLESRLVHQEPDDHIGLQLQFLAHLSDQTAACLNAGDWAGASPLIAGQRECVEQHLLRWVHTFADRVVEHACSGFYKGAALLVLGTLAADRDLLHRPSGAPATV